MDNNINKDGLHKVNQAPKNRDLDTRSSQQEFISSNNNNNVTRNLKGYWLQTKKLTSFFLVYKIYHF